MNLKPFNLEEAQKPGVKVYYQVFSWEPQEVDVSAHDELIAFITKDRQQFGWVTKSGFVPKTARQALWIAEPEYRWVWARKSIQNDLEGEWPVTCYFGDNPPDGFARAFRQRRTPDGWVVDNPKDDQS